MSLSRVHVECPVAAGNEGRGNRISSARREQTRSHLPLAIMRAKFRHEDLNIRRLLLVRLFIRYHRPSSCKVERRFLLLPARSASTALRSRTLIRATNHRESIIGTIRASLRARGLVGDDANSRTVVRIGMVWKAASKKSDVG